ncbi:hypothetical protein FGG08_002728 [Glutinoglossum americanum]|uniref:Peptide hydrolase n=1 Tax=Glutinoglossum americanum TaxID=1670608 RepID=A0A9P8IB06_9PEZI|nr:hypothetical protein FGG08_002728 [Glutinoglossum americanum]
MPTRRSKALNPFGFAPLPVTIITTVAYVALIISLLVTHLVVPSAPRNATPFGGVNLTEAWGDLQELTSAYHPYNSRRNDEVRDWLLRRVETILNANGVGYSTQKLRRGVGGVWTNRTFREATTPADIAPAEPVQPYSDYMDEHEELRRKTTSDAVIIFDDMLSNVTFSAGGVLGSGRTAGQSVYFEGTNIIVYIRGSEDDESEWWNNREDLGFVKKPNGKGGVLVNAHYDSVSTGYGATDDGVGVVTILQLIKYFTTPGNMPRKGLVALLNNGEEDFLNGARAFSRHPISQFAHTFLNLEGAGAGGRATLFRSTDTEVTRFYRRSKYPFGTVVSGDGFKSGMIRSQTDYIIFNGVLGLRGLDVAFWEPRARYHTDQDDARHRAASIDSLWHMLSASLPTLQGLTSDTSLTFESRADEAMKNDGKVRSGQGSDGVWFDMFGHAFAVFQLHTLFALSLTLLIVSPLAIFAIVFLLQKGDKLYLFSRKTLPETPLDDPIPLYGWRGLTRFPIAFAIASGAVIGLAFLVTKVNPFIVYSSQYAVWSMTMSAWFVLAWSILRGADDMRPSALHRGYAWLWLFLGSWAIMVGVTVLEDRQRIAGGYFLFFYFSAVFLATVITLVEYFALPTIPEYASHVGHGQPRHIDSPSTQRSGSRPASSLLTASAQPAEENPIGSDGQRDEEETVASETTPLFRSERRTTFANYSRSFRRASGGEDTTEEEGDEADVKMGAYGDEQLWSGKLPKWTWLLQFILVAPIVVVLVGQVGLLVSTSMSQTGADGSSVLFVYVVMSLISILILAPLGPFLHRFTYHIPLFILLVFIGTLIYNLVAFPFSANNRLKVHFIQTVNLESGINRVSLTGVQPFVRGIIGDIPSASGQKIDCSPAVRGGVGLTTCSWTGPAPRVVGNVPDGAPPSLGYEDWLHYNASRVDGKNRAKFRLYGLNTRACKIVFDKPISDFSVEGASVDDRFERVPPSGSQEIRLWRREWERPWDVDVRWPVSKGKKDGDEGMDGKVVCLWSDDNEIGVIPALDEVRKFAPEWVAVSKLADGLVEGEKMFML